MFREQRQYGNDPEIVRRSKTKFREPVSWSQGRLVFTCSWSDWFHPAADAWRAEAWEVIRDTPRHTYQILTKRPELIAERLPPDWGDGYPNVWLGVSVENAAYTWRADVLRGIPAALRFISAEPLLGSLFPSSASAATSERVPVAETGPDPAAAGRKPASRTRDAGVMPPGQAGPQERVGLARDTRRGHSGDDDALEVAHGRARRAPLDLTGIGWVIVGGESGPRGQARPMHPRWAREIRDACLAHEDPPAFHMKQWGSWTPDPEGRDPKGPWLRPAGGALVTSMQADAYDLDLDGAVRVRYAGPRATSGGKLLDGVDWCEIPERAEPVTALF